MYDPTFGRFLSQDPIGFDAEDPNLYRYVGNGPTNATDPTGLKEFTITIYYYLPSFKVNAAVQKEVDRILQQAFAKYADKKHTLKVVLKQLSSEQAYDSQTCGYTGLNLGFFYADGIDAKIHENPKLDELQGGKVGQGRDFKAGIGPKKFANDVRKGNLDGDKALATVIVHELIFHGIYWHVDLSKAHLHTEGFIDAEKPKVGGDLSKEACELLVDKLGAD